MPIETDNHLPEWRPIPKIGESDMEGDKGVDPDDNAPGGEQPIFRPHAFALSHGEGGAKIAFGNFYYRYDTIQIGFFNGGSGLGTNPVTSDNVVAGSASQSPTIKGYFSRIPKLKTPDGSAMEASPVPNKYHELGAYGDVYLYWTVDSDGPATGTDADFVSKCWVQVGNVAEGSVALGEMAALHLDNYSHNRLTTAGDADLVSYQIKIGRVPSPTADEDISQELSSDVYWSPFILTRREDS